MADTPTVYTDDTDASWTFTVTSRDGGNVDWTSPVVAIGPGSYTVAATWDTAASPSRKLKVPLTGLTTGLKTLYLRVPSGTDIALGSVYVRAR